MSGSEHELPHALGSCPGDRHRIKSGFDDGHVLELVRKVIFVECLLENRHVVLAEPQDGAHLGRHLFRIEDHVVADLVVVGKCDEGVHFLQPGFHHIIRDIGGEPDGVHVVAVALLVLSGLAVKVPDAQKTVGYLRRVVLRIEPGRCLELVFLVDVDHLVGDAVFLAPVFLQFVQNFL